MECICEVFEVTEMGMKGRSKTKSLATARKAFAYAMRKKSFCNVYQIGSCINVQDRSSIDYYLKEAVRLFKSDIKFQMKMHKSLKLIDEKLSEHEKTT